MSVEIIASVLIPAGSLAVAYLAFRGATRAARQQESAAEKAVDAEAYERARKQYDSIIDQLDENRRGLQDEVARLRTEVGQLRNTNDQLLDQVGKLRREVATLTQANRDLHHELETLRH